MILHILRHAEAVERSPQLAEEHRYLTCRGRIRFRKAAASIRKELDLEPDLILTSPLIRAVQTADILAEELGYEGEILIDTRLAPGFGPKTLAPLLTSYPDAKEIVIVGHEPDFGRVTADLLGSEGTCTLKKGGMVSVKRGNGKVSFLQYVTGSGKVLTSRSDALERLQQG